jgi:predicted anti-sigma-YlaC factor YlaD
MKCEDVSKELIPYLDRRASSADRHEVEEHLAACAGCRTRAEELRTLWSVLDEVPIVQPSLGFDARMRARIAEEPRARWYRWFVPQPRLAMAMALLLAVSVWITRLPQDNSGLPGTAQSEHEQFQVIKNLDVLENYDVLSKFDALDEVPADEQATPADQPNDQQKQQDDGT